MMIKGNFGDLIDPAIRKVFDDRYKMHPEQYSQVFQVMESDRHQELLSSIGSLGLAHDVSEGAEITNTEFPKKFSLIKEEPKEQECSMAIHSKQSKIKKYQLYPYLAGFIDGGGWITTIEKRSIQLGIFQKNPNVLHFIQNKVGGKVVINKRGYYTWYVYGDNALKVIQKCLSYFVIKQKQAMKALERKKRMKVSMSLGQFYSYLAGIIDSEGGVGLKKTTGLYSGIISVQSTDKVLIDFIKMRLGFGSYKQYARKEVKNGIVYQARFQNEDCLKLLRKIDKFLIQKKPEAQIVRRLQERKEANLHKGKKISEEEKVYRQKAKEKIDFIRAAVETKREKCDCFA